jgi:hypothetical protein
MIDSITPINNNNKAPIGQIKILPFAQFSTIIISIKWYRPWWVGGWRLVTSAHHIFLMTSILWIHWDGLIRPQAIKCTHTCDTSKWLADGRGCCGSTTNHSIIKMSLFQLFKVFRVRCFGFGTD